MRDLKATMEWYREHDTAEELGFNPDGMCQRICRTARDLDAHYPTAKAAQDATPDEHRFYKVSELRKGMAIYYDDPNDSNVAGHVTTMVGRVKGFDENSLHDVLVKTNSVKTGEIVVVRGDYFQQHWGDKFQFGSDMVNGEVVDVFTRPTDKQNRATLQDFRDSRPDWDVKILDKLAKTLPEVKAAVDRIEKGVEALPDDKDDSLVAEFKQHFDKKRELKMSLLNEAVKDGRRGTVLNVRNNLRAAIKLVLPR